MELPMQIPDQDMNQDVSVFRTPPDLLTNRVRVETELPDFFDARVYDEAVFVALQDFSCNIDVLPLAGNPAVLIVQTALPHFEILPHIVALLNNQDRHLWQYIQGQPIPRIIDKAVYSEDANGTIVLCTPIYVLSGQHVVLGHAVVQGGQLLHYQVFDTGTQTEQYRQYVEIFMIDLVYMKTQFLVDPTKRKLQFRRLSFDETCEECVAVLYSFFILDNYERVMNPRKIRLTRYAPLYHNVNKFYVQSHYIFEQIIFKCVELSQSNNYITQIPVLRRSRPLLIWVFKLLFIKDAVQVWFQQYLNNLPIIDPAANDTVSESTPDELYDDGESAVDVEMDQLMDTEPQQQFVVPAQSRFSLNDGVGQIASGICAVLERQQQRLANRMMQGQYIYWQLTLGFTRRNRDIARRYTIGFNANQIAKTSLQDVFRGIVQFLSELHDSFTTDYADEAEVEDGDNVHFNIRIEDFQFGTQEEINALVKRSQFAGADKIRALSVIINRIGRDRGNKAYTFNTKLNSVATKLCDMQNGEFYTYLDSSQGIADHHCLQQLQIDSFHLIEQLDQIKDTKFMKKPCLEQTFLAILIDISSKTNLLSEPDRAFVHAAVTNKFYLYQQSNTQSLVDDERLQRLVDIVVSLCVNKNAGFYTSEELQKLQIQSKSGCVNQFVVQLNQCLHRHNQRCQPQRRFQVKLLTVAQLYQLIQIQSNRNRQRRHDKQVDEPATISKVLDFVHVEQIHADDLYILLKFRLHVYVYNIPQLINACNHIVVQGSNLYQRPCMELCPSPSMFTFNIEGVRRKFEQFSTKPKFELKDQILQLLEETSIACNTIDFFTRFDYKTHLYKQTHVDRLMTQPTFKLDDLFHHMAYNDNDSANDGVDSHSLFTSHIFRSYQAPEQMSVRCGQSRVSLREVIIEQRKIYFSTVGLLAIDIETLTIDNNDGQGNQFPYVICVFGTYRSLHEQYSLKLTKARHTFRGLSCIKQFVSWLQTEGILLDPNNDTHNRNLAAHAVLNGNWVPFNTIVAHNGCKFDFKFILDEITNVTNIKTLGTSFNFKQLRTAELLFTDSFLLVGQSLAKFTSSFSANVTQRFSTTPTSEHQQLIHELYGYVTQNQKGNNTDIVSLTYTTYCEWEKNNDPKLLRIHDYCLLDCSSLFFAFYVYLETVYTTPVARPVYIENYTGLSYVFPQTVIHVTAPSMTMQHYKMMQETVLRPNITALPIEQASYTGGLTMANISRGGIGVSIDINSSYPTAMMNRQPASHYPADSNYHHFQTKYISNDILVDYAYMETVRQINQTIDVSLGINATLMSAGALLNIESYCLYEISYRVDRSKCSMSAFQCMSMQQEMLIEPSQFIPHTEYDSKTKQIQGTWQWGINILYMLKEGYLESMYVSRMIRYEGVDLFGKFITGLYTKRLEAKAQNDEVRSHICKQLMNYLYGKFGQKTLDVVHRGEPEELYDLVLEYNQLNQHQQLTPRIPSTLGFHTEQMVDEGIHMESHLLAHNNKVSYKHMAQNFKFISANKKMTIKEVSPEDKSIADHLQLPKDHKVHRHCHQLVVSPNIVKQLHSVGSLTRVASLITSYGKLQLVQAYNKLMSLNRKDKPDIKVCYGDTDSLHLCMQDRIKWEVEQSHDTDIKSRFNFISLIQEKFNTSQHISPGELSYGAECLTKVVLWSDIYKQITNLQVYDATKFEQFVPVNMVDSLRLGGLKIEHLSAAQSFSAPKQYSQLQVDPIPNKIDQYTDTLGFAVKGKGVNKKALQQQPLAWVQQEKTYSHTVLQLTRHLLNTPSVSQFVRSANYIYFTQQLSKTCNPLHRQWIKQFLSDLQEPSPDYQYLADKTLKQTCFHFRSLLGKELDAYSANETVNKQLVEAAQSIACIFINAGSFQTTGNSVCIRSVMKTIMPSFKKRQYDLDGTERDGHVVTQPYDTLFHFELMQHVQTTILRHLRKLLVDTPEFKSKIVLFAQRADSTSFSSQIRLHLYTNSLAEQSIKQMMGVFPTETQRQISQQFLRKRIDKIVFDPLQTKAQQVRRINMIQLCYEITNLYRLMFITGSSMLSSILLVLSQHLTVRTQFIVLSQPGQHKSNVADIEFDIAFFLMVYCDVFNIQEQLVQRFKDLFMDITKKFDNEKYFKQKILENHIQKKKADQYRDLAQLASDICSHSLLHRNHLNELVLCNTRFLIYTLFKKHKDMTIPTDGLYDMLIAISLQSRTTPYQQTIVQARQLIQSNIYHFLKQLKQDNLTIYSCFEAQVDVGVMDENNIRAEQAVCVNEPLLTEEEQEAQRKYTMYIQQGVAYHKKTLEREQRLFDQQIKVNQEDDQQAMMLLNELIEGLEPPKYVNVIRNAADSDDQSD